MARFRRVNLDGKSITETRIAAAELKPATFAVIADGKFTPAQEVKGQLYVVMPAYHQGGGIEDPIAEEAMAICDYAEEGREFALAVEAGTYKKDTALTIKAGKVAVAAESEAVIAFVQEDIKLDAPDFIRVRVQRIAAAASPAA